jgi:trimeric autotransporter adhesin
MRRGFAAVLSILAVSFTSTLLAQESRDAVPLNDWPVPFEQIRAKVMETEPLRIAERSLHPSANAVPSAASHFITVVPCRILDTRMASGPYGGPAFTPGLTRTFNIPGGPCAGIPIAAAYSLNFTIVGFDGGGGFVSAFPSGTTRPLVSTMDFGKDPAFALANAAIIPADATGSIDVYSSGNTQLIIDINGYFVEGVVTNLNPGTGMTGGGTGNVTLGIANSGVGTAQIADGAVTDAKVATITSAGKVANSATTATSANVANTIVARDGAGDFAAGALTLFGKIDQTSINGLVARGTFGSGTIPTIGPGTRMMWYPGKAAFRAGYVTSTQWDDANVGEFSTAMGYNSTAWGYSTAMGYSAFASGFASTAMGYAATTIGLYSTAMGEFTTASGDVSTAMGDHTTASGAGSTAMGSRTTASGAGSTAMGDHTTASGDYSTAIGAYASTSEISRLGEIQHAGAFVYGDASTVSTSSLVRASADNQFVVRAAGGTTFYSNAAMTIGVSLAANGASWAMVSDRNRKEDFRDINGEEILHKLAALPVTSWRYKNDDSGNRYIGPMAQDFHALFGLGTDTTIATLDVDGVTFAGIKALERRTADLQTENNALGQRTADLQAENTALRDQLGLLMRRVDQLEVKGPAAQ